MRPPKKEQREDDLRPDRSEWDLDLVRRARAMKVNVQASPELWLRIERRLEAEKQRSFIDPSPRRRFLRPAVLVPAFACLMIVLIGLFSMGEWLVQTSGLLTDPVVRRSEKREASYIMAIERLEEQALPRMADLNLEVMLLYREQLKTIDDQIQSCRELLENNPANAHIRCYMLAALQDKKQTLGELLEWKNPGNGQNHLL
jgi:hypothetical protein